MGLNRYDARRDSNERDVILALRKIGVKVYQQDSPFDLLIVEPTEFITFEVKDGSKPPSKRELTPIEEEFFGTCRALLVPHYVVTSAEQAVEIIQEHRRARWNLTSLDVGVSH